MKMQRGPQISDSMRLTRGGFEYNPNVNSVPMPFQNTSKFYQSLPPSERSSQFRPVNHFQPSMPGRNSKLENQQQGYLNYGEQAHSVYSSPNPSFTSHPYTHNSNDLLMSTLHNDGSATPSTPLPARRQFTGSCSPPSQMRDIRKRNLNKPMSLNINNGSEMLVNNTLDQSNQGLNKIRRDINAAAYRYQQSPGLQRSNVYSASRKYSNEHKKPTEQTMTITDLRSFADRQINAIELQKKHLKIKSKELNDLHSKIQFINKNTPTTHVSRYSGTISPIYQAPKFVVRVPNYDLTDEQESKLHKLRRLRGQTERERLANQATVEEISTLDKKISTKEREVASCREHAEELTQRALLINDWCKWLAQVPGTPVNHPDKSPPFVVPKDEQRWRLTFGKLQKLIESIKDVHNNLQIERQTPSCLHNVVDSPANLSSVTPSLPRALPIPVSSPVVLKSEPQESLSNQVTTPVIPFRTYSPLVKAQESNHVSNLKPEVSSTILNNSKPLLSPVPIRAQFNCASKPSTSDAANSVTLTRPKARMVCQKFITDTYLTPQRRDNFEKYKLSATENLHSNKLKHNFPNVLNAISNVVLSDTNGALTPITHKEPAVEVVLPEAHFLPVKEEVCNTVKLSNEETHSSNSSSTSSLNITETISNNQENDLLVNGCQKLLEETEAGGSGDSAIADTEINANLCASLSPPVLKKDVLFTSSKANLSPPSSPDEGVEFIDTSQPLKSIIRRNVSKYNRNGSQKGVKFHPLALLLDAAIEGDISLVKAAAAEVSDVSEPNDEGITALHNAVCAGRLDVSRFLVEEAGADVNAGDTDGWTPLHCAASCDNVHMARLLVEHGASLFAQTLSDNETSLEKCDQVEHDSECERYLDAEQNLLGVSENGRVYAIFPRGEKAAGPGSPNAQIAHDELPIYPNEVIHIVDRCPSSEPNWMLAENSALTRGLVPRAFISRFPLVRIPPASLPIPLKSPETNVDTKKSSNFDKFTNEDIPEMVELSIDETSQIQSDSFEESADYRPIEEEQKLQIKGLDPKQTTDLPKAISTSYISVTNQKLTCDGKTNFPNTQNTTIIDDTTIQTAM